MVEAMVARAMAESAPIGLAETLAPPVETVAPTMVADQIPEVTVPTEHIPLVVAPASAIPAAESLAPLRPEADAATDAVDRDIDEEAPTGEDGGTSVIFPLARIKKIIKADPEVKTVNKEALQLIAKTTELLLMELASAAQKVAERNNHKSVNYNDIATVVRTHEVFCFLEDTIRPSTSEQTASRPVATESAKRARPAEADMLPDPKQTKLAFAEQPKAQPASRGLVKTADAAVQDENQDPASAPAVVAAVPAVVEAVPAVVAAVPAVEPVEAVEPAATAVAMDTTVE